jgi:hypothetical protein
MDLKGSFEFCTQKNQVRGSEGFETLPNLPGRLLALSFQ